jgi:hypothetical protein
MYKINLKDINFVNARLDFELVIPLLPLGSTSTKFARGMKCSMPEIHGEGSA